MGVKGDSVTFIKYELFRYKHNTSYNKIMNEKNSVVGVTGANGFIGRNIVNKLRNEGFKVISLQRTIPSSSNYETRIFDLCKLDTINEELLHDIDILIHNAALVHKPKQTHSNTRQ